VTIIRAALHPKSALSKLVKDGLQAVSDQDRGLIDDDVRATFVDSLDLDEALRPDHPAENRWDYLLGHGPSSKLVALEPHSAETAEIAVVIRKRKAARDQLGSHLRKTASIHSWYWVASGRVAFVTHEKAINRLNQEGIRFVGTKLLRKHLPGEAPEPAKPTTKRTKKR